MRRLILHVALLLALAPTGADAARLDYRGEAVSRRQAEPLLAAALRAPGDSLALVRALGRLCARLQAEGYLDARARGAWALSTSAGEEPRLGVEVAEGPRYRWAQVRLESASAAESLALAEALELKVGAPASAAALGEAVGRAVDRLADSGYPYAQMAINAFEWDSAGARTRLSGARGPRVTVSGTRIEGLRTTRPALAERSVARVIGEPYHRAAAQAGRERLVQLGLFRSVAYEGLEGEGDWSRARLLYRVEELRYNRFEGAVGSQSEGRVIGLLQLELANLAGTGRALATRWESRAAEVEVFAARYVEPLALGAPLRIEAALEHHREDTLFTRSRWGARFHFLLSGRERIEAGYEQDRVIEPQGEAREAELQSTVFALERDGRDDPRAPRRGTRARLSASQIFKHEALRPSGRRKSRASAVEGWVAWHRPLGRGFGLAWESSGAARFSSQPTLAFYERYPLGGAATLRGYDEQTFRADRFGLSRFEGRWFAGAGAQHLALFWDHAWMLSRLASPGGTRLEVLQRDGIGFGLRFESPAGRIGVDYGVEAGRPPAEGKLHLQLVSSF